MMTLTEFKKMEYWIGETTSVTSILRLHISQTDSDGLNASGKGKDGGNTIVNDGGKGSKVFVICSTCRPVLILYNKDQRYLGEMLAEEDGQLIFLV
jgi:hypothetical protein